MALDFLIRGIGQEAAVIIAKIKIAFKAYVSQAVSERPLIPDSLLGWSTYFGKSRIGKFVFFILEFTLFKPKSAKLSMNK